MLFMEPISLLVSSATSRFCLQHSDMRLVLPPTASREMRTVNVRRVLCHLAQAHIVNWRCPMRGQVASEAAQILQARYPCEP